ncbi:hypothetical protein [Apilactobacillus timberlakei]|uniref:NIPSNAP domain-containing protein n=1 Tax=Apilactobacillus timberlakei TaxID=2008380 RepID=A0ABY2YRD3_9LACO|nr:hypothetical protein [Apilactobacillus timberlakei]TPR12304.1 hypothetical protein DY048_07860 [Apilactobacillus timberlakei]TPR12907.1 hypothetical protein DY052_08965 [Apilactobacillus timberlakei]
MKQLRIYTLKDKKSAKEYLSNHWTKHMKSLPKFGINVDNVFMEKNSLDYCRVFAIVSTEKDNLIEMNKKYMNSNDFIDDMSGFNMDNIIKVEDINLIEFYK